MRRTEDALDRLRELAAKPDAAALRLFAAHKSCHVVARAATIAESAELASVTPDLAQSFHRFLADPVKTDPGCTAKNAIASALIALNSLDASVYLAGVRHVQMEGTFGPPEDRAAALRGICAIGLAQINHPTAAAEIVDLLFDREAPARAGAIRALAQCPMPESESVLRMKALAGDKESAVTGEVFTGLMSQWPAKSAAFIARFLNRGDIEVAEEAALAIANWRDERAWQILRPHLDRPDPPRGGGKEKKFAQGETFACASGDGVRNSASILPRGFVTLALFVLSTAAAVSPIFIPQKFRDAEDDFRPLRLGVSAVFALAGFGTQF